ncbi:MAG TPA: 30S ribosomal protein S20, partial [Polyangiaceae bacterium]|nr:30S ribosomal protein S20 [Polyangiaceae bacterium]
ARNRAVKSAVRTAVKKARVAVGGGDPAAATESVRNAARALARAASKGIIPKRTASRVTSRIESALAKASRPAAG